MSAVRDLGGPFAEDFIYRNTAYGRAAVDARAAQRVARGGMMATIREEHFSMNAEDHPALDDVMTLAPERKK